MSDDALPSSTWQSGPTAWTYVSAVARRWLLVGLAALVSAGGAYAVSRNVLPEVYESTATVIVMARPSTPTPDEQVVLDPFIDDQSLSETFAQLAAQPSLVENVARELGTTAEDIRGRVTVHAVPRTPLVSISVRAADPREAAGAASTYTAAFVQTTQDAQWLPGQAMVVSGSTVPSTPVSPRPILNAVVAGLAGLVLAVLVVWLRVRAAAGRAARRERDAARSQPAAGAAPAGGPTRPADPVLDPRTALHVTAPATPQLGAQGHEHTPASSNGSARRHTGTS